MDTVMVGGQDFMIHIIGIGHFHIEDIGMHTIITGITTGTQIIERIKCIKHHRLTDTMGADQTARLQQTEAMIHSSTGSPLRVVERKLAELTHETMLLNKMST